jgi:DNA polymerase-3 subunit beta
VKIIAEQGAIARVTARIANVAVRGGTIPILQNVLIQATAEGVWLSATNLDMDIRERLDADVEAEGEITLPAASLAEITRHAPAGAQVAIAWDGGTDPRATVRFGRSRYLLPVLPSTDFPKRQSLSEAVDLQMPAGQLLTLLDHVHFAQSTEETRHYLNGTYLHTVSDGGRQVLRLVATDGHRLVIDQCPVDGPSFPGVIIPRGAVGEFRRLLTGAKGDVELSVSRQAVALEVGDARVISKVIEGSYPDYLRVCPHSWDREILIDRAALQAAVKRVAIISADRTRNVKLSIDDEVLTLTVRNMEAGVADEEVEVLGRGPHFETGFQAKYLLDLLEQTDADQMAFRVNDGGSPARLDPCPGTKGADGVINVIMPLRV